MANTVHGPFTPGASTTTGSYGTGVGQVNTYTSGNANNDETQASVALASFNPDLVTAAFILSGVACVKDATTASQLNVTSGESYLLMSDGTYALIDVAADTFSTTGHASTTMYLDLNPDGSWSWATTHSASAHYLPICQATTDGSANIASVTDKRVLLAALLSGAAHPSVTQPGGVSLPAPLKIETTQNAAYAATVNGGVTFGQTGLLSGSMDGAASFNGTSGYLASATMAGMPTGAAAWSMEGWFNASALPASGNAYLIRFGAAAANESADLQLTSAGVVQAAIAGNASFASGATVTTNTRHYVCVTWDGTTLALYMDGAAAVTATPTGVNLGTSGGIVIGGSYGGSSYFSGALDEVAIYGAALSSTRVSAHYSAGVSTTSDGYAAAVLADAPLRYYRLGDAAGASVAADTTSVSPATVVDAAGALSGALLVDSEGGQTVMRTTPLANPLVIQVNGHNTTFGAGGNLTLPGAVASVGGQASAGSFGAPVIVAQALRVPVTATTLQTILTYTPSVTGIYRITGLFYLGNSANQTILFKVAWTDADAGASANFFILPGGTTSLNGSSTTVARGSDWTTVPYTYDIAAGSPITVTYQDPAGTPNDYVSVLIERLA